MKRCMRLFAASAVLVLVMEILWNVIGENLSYNLPEILVMFSRGWWKGALLQLSMLADSTFSSWFWPSATEFCVGSTFVFKRGPLCFNVLNLNQQEKAKACFEARNVSRRVSQCGLIDVCVFVWVSVCVCLGVFVWLHHPRVLSVEKNVATGHFGTVAKPNSQSAVTGS